MKTQRYYNLLAISDKYNKMPSEWFDDLNDYERYCFDEASYIVIHRLQSGEQIKVKKSYSNFSDYYKNLGV